MSQHISTVTIPLKEYEELKSIKESFEKGEGYFRFDHYTSCYYGTEKSGFVKELISTLSSKFCEYERYRTELSELKQKYESKK